MNATTVSATDFKAKCLALIDEMNRTNLPVTITKRGKPVAILTPVPEPEAPKSLFGALAGSVYRYDDPFEPAIPIGDWEVMR